ncbi:MAG: AAA family ATPase, partial [Bradymonadaceae bacterium]
PEGELTGRVRTQPHTVLLFDEIEKAHRDVLDLLLQILGEGRLTDAAGRSVDFCNTLVAMTSNLGAQQAEGRDTDHYRRAAEEFFRPEFFNRLDRVVTYRPLGRQTLRRIARRALGEILRRRGLQQPNILVDVSPGLVDYLVEDAEGCRYGARTLEHRIERRLLTPLARQLTRHDDTEAELTRVRIVPGTDRDIDLELTAIHPPEPAEAPERLRPTDDPEPRIHRLLARVVGLRDSDTMATLEDRHESLLEEFNVADAAASDASEALRQCEIVRGQFADLADRTRDLFGEEAPDEPELPELDAFDQTRRHQWHERLDDLHDHVLWVSHQLATITDRRVDAGTLVVRGLAGPTARLVELWWGLAAAFGDHWDIEIAVAAARDGRWQAAGHADLDAPPDLRDETDSLRHLAVSAEHPGIRRIFALLADYVWAPKPPTLGRHALVLAEHRQWGTSDPDHLADRLADTSEVGDDEAKLEFRLEEGTLRDLRLGTDDTAPAVGAGGFREFANELILRRLEI